MRIVVSGGGTGGHIMPAIAIAEALRATTAVQIVAAETTEVLFIGGVSGMETEIVPRYGIPYRAVTSRKLRKVMSPATVGVIASLAKGYLEARRYIREFRTDVVVGTGGYAAAATLLAASHLGIPTIIHEGNVVAGRTNLLLARRAWRICVTFEDTVREFPAEKTVVTGLPLRAGTVADASVSRASARASFGSLASDRFTVFVTGGSQGARKINQVLLEALPALRDAGMQIIHHTGIKHYDEVTASARSRGFLDGGWYHPIAFLNEREMPLAMRGADVMVARGGVSTLAEAAANQLPVIIVPLPSAYADHQTFNARAMEKAGAAVHLPEAQLTAESLAARLRALKSEPVQLQTMRQSSIRAVRPDAANEMVSQIQSVYERRFARSAGSGYTQP